MMRVALKDTRRRRGSAEHRFRESSVGWDERTSAAPEEPCDGLHRPFRRPEHHIVTTAPLSVHCRCGSVDSEPYQKKREEVLSQGIATVRLTARPVNELAIDE